MPVYMIYTSEGSCEDPNGNNIDNGQVLDFAIQSPNPSSAIKRFMEESPWALKSGYDSVVVVEIVEGSKRYSLPKENQ